MKLTITYAFLLTLAACGSPQESTTQSTEMKNTYRFLLGSYTSEPQHGIYLAAFDPNTDSLWVEAVASDPSNPSFVIVNQAQDRVYCVEETGGEDGGKVSAFSLSNGTFSRLNTVSAGGNGPCYVAFDPSERFVVVGNYSGGNFSVIPIAQDGSLKEAVQSVAHSGSSVNPRRQTKPYVHSAVFHKKDGRLLIADLGTDEVVVYDFATDMDRPLTEEPLFRLKVEPGAGPRHMVFNEAGDRLYLVHEITAAIGVYSYNDGKLEHVETHTLLQDGFEGSVGAAEVRLSPDGKHLYASNRGEANELIVFEVTDGGKLTHIQTVSSGGNAPRNFQLTPDGKYLLAGNQNSNNVVVFERDANTGKIIPTGVQMEVHKPVYFTFIR